MGMHPARGRIAVPFRDRLHDGVVLVAGSANAIALPQLGAAEGAQPRTNILRLLGEKRVVRRAVDAFVELRLKAS